MGRKHTHARIHAGRGEAGDREGEEERTILIEEKKENSESGKWESTFTICPSVKKMNKKKMRRKEEVEEEDDDASRSSFSSSSSFSWIWKGALFQILIYICECYVFRSSSSSSPFPFNPFSFSHSLFSSFSYNFVFSPISGDGPTFRASFLFLFLVFIDLNGLVPLPRDALPRLIHFLTKNPLPHFFASSASRKRRVGNWKATC